MNIIFEKARKFIYRNSRPIDIARWKHHFEAGNKNAVLTALAAYQNEDGGFGHGLEADSWNPDSSPIQTWAATEILREIDFKDKSHTVIQGILHYLESGKDFDGHFWYNTVESNKNYPHAPWWHTDSDSTRHNDYNPTAALAGFIICFADKQSELYKLGLRVTKEALEQLFAAQRQNDMHTSLCYVRLMESCEEADVANIFGLCAFREKMLKQVKDSITQNIVEWESSYICKPSQFLNSKDSIFYVDNKNIAEYECEHIAKTQLADGSWSIPWSWKDYPNEWAVSKNWWKSNGIILNLLYLRGFGKL
ncbi:MAG: hypothetical protein ACOX8S_11770 [Christensenellales bacterium]|jgi:hypothetical protein